MKVKGELNETKDDEKIFTKKQKNIIINKNNSLLDQIPKLEKNHLNLWKRGNVLWKR